MNHKQTCCTVFLGSILVLLGSPGSQQRAEAAEPQYFDVGEHQAFVIEPPDSSRIEGVTPWVFYAPTFTHRLPGPEEDWMIKRIHDCGISIAGIDVGESYGSPKGRAAYQALYEELTSQRGYGKKPVLLARSRGGLMLYNWAVEHPDSVAGVAGIYPVCNIESYPGVAKAAGAYQMTAEQLQDTLAEHNPISRLAPLAKAKVPILHIHGDQDQVVPLETNSAELASNYRKVGGPVEIEVIEGQGHNMWDGWFQSQKLTEFIVSRALATTKTQLPDPDGKPADMGKPVQVFVLLGQSIRGAARSSGLSVYRIAKETGLDQSALNRFLNGTRDNLRLDVANRLFDFFELRIVSGKAARRK